MRILENSRNFLCPFNSSTFNDTKEREAFENIAGKEENAGNKYFLLFQNIMFLPYERQKSPLESQ